MKRKRILNFGDYLKESISNPTPEELQGFLKDLMSGNTQLQKHHRNYKVDVKEVRDMVQSIVYTPELIAELKRRKIEIPDVSKMKMSVEKKQYHRCFEYNLADNMKPDEWGDIDQRFAVSVTIEVPYDESFEDDNTMITASIYIKNRGRLKELFGYANKRAQKDKEFNSLSVGAVLQNAYQDLVSKMK